VKTRERPFTIGDAMLLVGAASLGLALLRSTLVDSPSLKPSPSLPLFWIIETVGDRLMFFITLGWAVVRMRRPHPKLRVMLRRVGSSAGWAATLGVLVCLVFGATNVAFRPPHPNLWQNWHILRILFFLNILGPIVLGVMSALLLSRRWRMRGGWIELMGLGVGSYWAFWSAYGIIKPVFHHYLPAIG